MTNENDMSVGVEFIAKAYATNGLILILTSKEQLINGEYLANCFRDRMIALRPISIKDSKALDDAGLKDMEKCLYKQIPCINLNKCEVNYDDEYEDANLVLSYSSNNENNLLVVIKGEEDNIKLNNAIKVANALKIGVLYLDPRMDFEELCFSVERYLFK